MPQYDSMYMYKLYAPAANQKQQGRVMKRMQVPNKCKLIERERISNKTD